MKSWAQKMACPHCGARTNCRSVSGKDLALGFEPKYASKKTIGGIDFDVYKRVRECAGCSKQFITYEIAEEELDLIVEYLMSPDDVPKANAVPKTKLQQFMAWAISKITKMKLPRGG